MAEHTALPWGKSDPWMGDGDNIVIGHWDANGRTVIAFLPREGRAGRNDETGANAALILRAVNAHEALVAALVGLLRENGHSMGCLGGNAVSLPCELFCQEARAALAMVRGES